MLHNIITSYFFLDLLISSLFSVSNLDNFCRKHPNTALFGALEIYLHDARTQFLRWRVRIEPEQQHWRWFCGCRRRQASCPETRRQPWVMVHQQASRQARCGVLLEMELEERETLKRVAAPMRSCSWDCWTIGTWPWQILSRPCTGTLFS